MEIIELLRKLRGIKADPHYTRESRAFILRHSAENVGIPARKIISGIFRSGWSIALTAALLLMAVSSFSILKIIYPATTAVVDITGLKAEAQAIDEQIELTNVAYNASLDIENKTSTTNMVLPAPRKKAVKSAGSVTASEKGTSTAPTIDSVLETLSE